MKVTASIFLRDADSPTLVDFFQREKRSTFIAPSMKKSARQRNLLESASRSFVETPPYFAENAGSNKTIDACTSSDVKEAVPLFYCYEVVMKWHGEAYRFLLPPKDRKSFWVNRTVRAREAPATTAWGKIL
jgi:hypothetical protein